MNAARKGHALVQRMEIPPMPELLARAAGADTVCGCGSLVKAQRTAEAWVYFCDRCGTDWSEPAPRERFKPKPRVKAPKRCQCAKACRSCGGQR